MKNRPERLIFFLVVWLTMFSFQHGWGQNLNPSGMKRDFLQLSYPGNMLHAFNQNPSYGGKKAVWEDPGRAWFSPNLISGFSERQDVFYSMPSNIYYMQSGFFCKREWELEKKTRIPLRFRLGSLADCNALEGKH
jgi:hypothetical protein